MIAFTAVLVTDATHLGHQQPIIFNTTLTNIGNAYNRHDGMFTAPVAGTYQFVLSIMATFGGEVQTELALNGQRIIMTFSHGSSGRNDQGCNAAILSLNSGDTVWVRTHSPSTNGIVYGNHFTTFSGHLLRAH
jgi:hypothetical protein